MDLGTVLENVDGEEYISPKTGLFDVTAFRKDARLVFQNAMLYNSPGTQLAKLAKRLLAWLDRALRDIPVQKPQQDIDRKENVSKQKGEDVLEEIGKDDSTDSEGGNKPSEDDSPKRDARDPERKARRLSDEKSTPLDKSPSGEEDSDDDAEDGELVEEEAEPKVKRSLEKEENSHAPENGTGDPAERLQRQIAALQKLKARAEGSLAEIDMERNVPMTAEERIALRDEVEKAPWERVDKVVTILQKYVDKAVAELGKGADPEYVTLELNDVEPHLLRDVEAVVRPDPRREMELKKIAKISADLEDAQSRLKSLKRAGGPLSSSRKKQRRRR